MTQLNKFVIKAIVLIALFMLSVVGISAQGSSLVRFVHVIPDAVPVDVYVNGTLAVQNLNYGEASTYISVPAGDHTVSATVAGLSTTLWEQNVSVGDDSETTFIASNSAAPQFDVFSDNLDTTGFGVTRLAVIHALAGGPDVAVQLAEAIELGGALQEAGTVLVPEITYGAKFGEFDLPSQNYVIDVLPVGGSADDAVLSAANLTLASNTSYMVVVYGTATNPEVLLLAAPTFPADDTGFARFVHGIVGAPAVDVLINDTVIIPNLSVDNPSQHIALPAGEHDVVLVETGTEDEIGTTSIEVDAGAAQTVAALVVDGDITISAFEDDLSGVAEDTSVASVLNTIDGSSVSVSLSDGTVIAEDTEAGEQSNSATFAPVVAEPTFTLTLGNDEGTISSSETAFYGGVYYNIIVLDGSAFGAPSLLIVPTALSQTLASAPSADTMTIVTGDPVATEAPADTSTEVTTETEAPVVSQPVTVPEDVITGEVALDPSANLNLRQFPNANALVLGQAPSGTLLVINGREGAPVALVEGQEPPPEAETFVDPVEELGEGQDLDPTQTWVSITYNTPDGGEIDAWVLSQFLIIRDDEGLVDLRDLETSPGNIPGETRNTDVTPPPAPEDIVTAEVINLGVNANLNIRRAANVDSEVLGQLTLGTIVELRGLLASSTGLLTDAEWAYIAYAPSQGGIITGWVSTSFLSYQRNNVTVDIDELVDRGLIDDVDESLVGEISAGAAPVTAATPDPQVDAYVAEVALDPGANLNLRRTPDVDAEVLVQIPSGAFVIVEARTADAEWLQTSFEGEEGWIASQFVIVTFNSTFVGDITEIPVDATVGGNTQTTTTNDDTDDSDEDNSGN